MRTIVFCLILMSCTFANVQAQVTYIGHRGASYLAPENTVASAKLAWQLGADAVEIDIYLSKDHKVIVHHDKSTKRQTGVDLLIKKTDSDKLRELDAGSFKDEKYKGEKIPFLKEIIETVPEGKILVVEIKCGSEVLPFVKKIVDASGKKDQIEFISFGWQTILDTKKLMPENKCYWLSSVGAEVKSKIRDAAQAGLGLDLSYRIIDKELMKQATDLGLEVLCWTVDDPQQAKRLVALGVKGITTNRPAWLKEQLNKE